ncbi:uncharacterized protein [Montipora foliosa]|uniref:uncharacterized protein n=1 Tax=Montipora foliosa TaxID=591990 RepID=UPI0035F10B83
MEVRISFSKGIPPPKEGDGKHVEFVGEDEREHVRRYKKLENTLFFKYLEYERPNFHDEIMIVTFNTQMQEQANIAFCKRILKSGIFCDKKSFNFLGHSDSQMREKTCFMMHGTEDEIQNHLKTFGNFVEDSNVSVRAKKIGLLFSPFLEQVELTKGQRDEVSNVKEFGYGFMSRGLASKIWEMDFFQGLNHPKPSALLVHYQGSQGMLVVKEADINDHHPWQDQVDESVRQTDRTVYILDYSQPNTNAYLDAKLIMLLAARGVQVENLRTLQKDYYNLLEDMMRNDEGSIDYFLQLTGRTSEEEVATLLQSEVSYMVERESSGGEVPHVRILIPRARVVFAVCDPYGKLTSEQCYFRPTLPCEQRKKFDPEKKVFVAPIPCYYPGDILSLELIHHKKEYENLIDCLVLPPSLAFKCGGADLSGNKFIVCWDPKLIPKQKVKPMSYKLTYSEKVSDTWAKCRSYFQSPQKSTKDLREELIDHFAIFKDDLPFQIDRTYMSLAAKESGLSQTQCEQLSRMFYQATNSMVDKEVLWKNLEELSDETGTSSRAGESPTETTSLLDDMEGKETKEDLRTSRDGSSGGLLNYWTCNMLKRDREFHVNGKILGDFKLEATRFVQKARQNHYID